MTYRDRVSESVQRQRNAERRRARIGLILSAVACVTALLIYFTPARLWIADLGGDDALWGAYGACAAAVLLGLLLRGFFARPRD